MCRWIQHAGSKYKVFVLAGLQGSLSKEILIQRAENNKEGNNS